MASATLLCDSDSFPGRGLLRGERQSLAIRMEPVKSVQPPLNRARKFTERPTRCQLREQLRPARFLSVPLLTLLTGVVFPLALAVLARPLFPRQAGGSLIVRDGIVGSELIGQDFTGPGYFHATLPPPQPCAAS